MATVLALSTMHSTKHSLHEEMLVEIPHNHQDNRLPALLVRRKTTTWLQCHSGTLLHRPSSCFSAEITPGQEGTMGSVEAGTHHFSSCHSTCSLSAVAQQKLHPVRTESWGQSAKVILVGLEPTIPGSVGRCLIHWATGPVLDRSRKHVISHLATMLDSYQVTRALPALPSCCHLETDCAHVAVNMLPRQLQQESIYWQHSVRLT